ncbi:MAG: TRAP transporter small permease [Oscillibacter sp.]|jgi:TRAP-type C4-dicarboxylate transport system permease small subunit|nr:TRAP transporter small permease [Oscillibacter sp.]
MKNDNGIIGVVHKLEKVEQYVAVILFNVILFSLFWQALSRKIGSPSSWTDETSRLLFVWMGVLGCHLAQRENIHVRIDAILLSLPKKIQLFIEAFINVVMIGLLGMIFYYSISIVQRKSFTPLVTLGIGESWLYAAMFLWTALTIIEMIAQLVNIFKHGEVVRSWVLEDAKNDFYDFDVDEAAKQLEEGEGK